MMSDKTFQAFVLESLNHLTNVVESLHEFVGNDRFPAYRDHWDSNANSIYELKENIKLVKNELMKEKLSQKTKDILNRF